MKLRTHDGDCSFYSALQNGRVIDGICTCGYGMHYFHKTNDCSQLYSNERLTRLQFDTKSAPFHMSYDSYAYLKALMEEAITKLTRNYQTACSFVPVGQKVGGGKDAPTMLDVVHGNFMKELMKLKKIQEDLHSAAQATNKNHPNPEMRKFWGIES